MTEHEGPMAEKMPTPEEIAAQIETEPETQGQGDWRGPDWQYSKDEDGSPFATLAIQGLDGSKRTLKIGIKVDEQEGKIGIKKFVQIVLPNGKIKTQEMIDRFDMLAIKKAFRVQDIDNMDEKHILDFLMDPNIARNVWKKLVDQSME
jgi:uncharacterized alpha/beta hydrolase family protein